MIAGIDYSTRFVDVVLLDEDTDAATWHRYELREYMSDKPRGDAFDRTRDVRPSMPESSFWDEVSAIGIEDPRGYNAGALYRIQGAILACLPTSLLVQPFPPSVWRKTVGLPGNASKQAVATFALERWYGAPLHGTFDVTDAYCVALATRTLIQVAAA